MENHHRQVPFHLLKDMLESSVGDPGAGNLQVLTNFEIARRIVEHEQKGKTRAEYRAELLRELSVRLTEEFGKGFLLRSARNASKVRDWIELVCEVRLSSPAKALA